MISKTNNFKIFNFIKKEFFFKFNPWTFGAFFIGLFIFIPMAEVLWNLTNYSENWEHIKETVLGRYIFGSFLLVFGTALVATIIGVSCAWLVACCEFPGRRFFEWALILPLAIPTYIAAYA